MRITMVMLITGILGVSGAYAAPRPEGGETSGATSLLTAERRAREAAERLRLPMSSPAQWKSGGQGWTPSWTSERPKAVHPPSK